MSNKNKKEKINSENKRASGFLNGLLSSPTPAKASGLSFTLAATLSVLLSAVFLLLLALLGLSSKEGFENTDGYLYWAYLLPQISTAIVLFLFFAYTKKSFAQTVKEQNCPWKYYLVAILLQIGLLSLAEINSLFLAWLGGLGYQDAGIALPSMDGFGFVGVFLAVAVLPAILEECLFRGALLSGLKQFGETAAVLICGGLFALYHQNPAQTLYQFCCGVAFALVAIRAKSVLPTVLSHFVNNAVILILTKCGVTTFQGGAYAAVLGVSLLCLIGALAYLLFLDKKEDAEKLPEETQKAETKNFWGFAAVGVIVCALNWILVLATGFGS